LASKHGGEGGIRTLGTIAGTLVFETSQFNHSCTSPLGLFYQTGFIFLKVIVLPLLLSLFMHP
jgi:hypothetical protein